MIEAENQVSLLIESILKETGQEHSYFPDLYHEFKGLDDRKILITGANGFIGGAFYHWLKKNTKSKVYGIDISVPNNESDISELDIRCYQSLRDYWKQLQPDIVVHAAAYKYVPEMEQDPWFGLETNIFGTARLVELASEYHCAKFLFISTDKAVNPSSLLGMSKRWGELYSLSRQGEWINIVQVLRFGNVLNSTGSLLPLLAQQFLHSGHFQLTHPNMVRYFIHLPVVLMSLVTLLTIDSSGIFVPEMGKPVLVRKIADLFEEYLGVNVPRTWIGVRSGEKLMEELIYGFEAYKECINEHLYSLESNIKFNGITESFRELNEAIFHRDLKKVNRIFSSILNT